MVKLPVLEMSYNSAWALVLYYLYTPLHYKYDAYISPRYELGKDKHNPANILAW